MKSDNNYLQELFIDEVKPALNRSSGGNYVKKITNSVNTANGDIRLYKAYVEPWVDKADGSTGTTASYPVSQQALSNVSTIPLRDNKTGKLQVELKPSANNAATSKQYVDNQDKAIKDRGASLEQLCNWLIARVAVLEAACNIAADSIPPLDSIEKPSWE